MVIINFTCDGQSLSESNALNFGTVQAGTTSAVKTVTITNTGDSDALQCVIEPKQAVLTNGFSSDIQLGTAQETYLAQKFSADINSSFYNYAVVGIGKNYINKTGGTIFNTSGTDIFVTKWEPPISGTSGAKVWGNVFSCVYI